ncbi:MAG: hypothetical protein IBX52_11355 [Bacterioplanes sp.]|nr:hypothetical protein [Bacterioplanes sp.]
MPWFLWMLLTVGVVAHGQDNDALLVDPVMDARSNFAADNYEFVRLVLADGIEMPGLNAHQQERVSAQYSIRPLNRRWQTFANIEEDPARLLHYRRYANRYNRMMWQLVMQHEQEQIRRQQY